MLVVPAMATAPALVLAQGEPLKLVNLLELSGRIASASMNYRNGVRALPGDLLACAPLALEASKQVVHQSLAEPDLAGAMRKTYPAAERMLARWTIY